MSALTVVQAFALTNVGTTPGINTSTAEPLPGFASQADLPTLNLSASTTLTRERIGNESGLLPTACTISKSDTVYFAFGVPDRLLRWEFNDGVLEVLSLGSEWTPAGVAWSDRLESLYVLDFSRNRILRTDRDGQVVEQKFIVGGQSPTSLAILGTSGFVLGGPTSFDRETTYLVATYERSGRHISSFHEQDQQTRLLNADTDPVRVVVTDEELLLVAEPAVPVVHVRAVDGALVDEIDVRPDGYKAPPRFVPGDDAQGDYFRWRKEWTPLVFVHAFDSWLIVAFEVHGPERYELQVRSREDSGQQPIALERLDSLPLCGRGNQLVTTSMNELGELEFSVMEYTTSGVNSAVLESARTE